MPLIHLPVNILKQLELEQFLTYCLKCSNCQICPVTLFSESYSPTESFIYDIIASEEPRLNENLWKCARCHSCETVCPFDISPHELFTILKEMSFKNGSAPKNIQELINQIIMTGRGFQVNVLTHKRRQSLNLASLTSDNVSTVQKLARAMKILEEEEN